MFLSSRSTSASMPAAIQAAFQPDVAGAEHDDPRRPHAGGAAEQHAAAAVVALEEVGADLDASCRPATSLIGASSGSDAVVELHGLVGDAGDAVLEQGVGDLGVGGQVEVGEQHQARAEVAELGGLGLLDLADQPGPLPDLGRGRRRWSAPARA